MFYNVISWFYLLTIFLLHLPLSVHTRTHPPTPPINACSDINTWLLWGRSCLNQLLRRDQVANQKKKYGEEIHACSETQETQANKNLWV